MQKYIGTKVIEAEPQEKDGVAGYRVAYPDGYVSWSPATVFEAAYRQFDTLDFGGAVNALKQGHKVTRAGWNGKGMCLYFVPEGAYPARTGAARSIYGDDALVPYRAYIAMKTAQGDVVPWVASQSDVLMDDWIVIDEVAIKLAA